VGLGDLWPFALSVVTAPFDLSCFCSNNCFFFVVTCSKGVSIWGDSGAGGARGREGGGPWGTSASGRFLSCTAGAGVVGTAGRGSSGVDFTLEDDGLLWFCPLALWLCNVKYLLHQSERWQHRYTDIFNYFPFKHYMHSSTTLLSFYKLNGLQLMYEFFMYQPDIYFFLV